MNSDSPYKFKIKAWKPAEGTLYADGRRKSDKKRQAFNLFEAKKSPDSLKIKKKKLKKRKNKKKKKNLQDVSDFEMSGEDNKMSSKVSGEVFGEDSSFRDSSESQSGITSEISLGMNRPPPLRGIPADHISTMKPMSPNVPLSPNRSLSSTSRPMSPNINRPKSGSTTITVIPVHHGPNKKFAPNLSSLHPDSGLIHSPQMTKYDDADKPEQEDSMTSLEELVALESQTSNDTVLSVASNDSVEELKKVRMDSDLMKKENDDYQSATPTQVEVNKITQQSAVFTQSQVGVGNTAQQPAQSQVGVGNFAQQSAVFTPTQLGVGNIAQQPAQSQVGVGNFAQQSAVLTPTQVGVGNNAQQPAQSQVGVGNIAQQSAVFTQSQVGVGNFAQQSAQSQVGVSKIFTPSQVGVGNFAQQSAQSQVGVSKIFTPSQVGVGNIAQQSPVFTQVGVGNIAQQSAVFTPSQVGVSKIAQQSAVFTPNQVGIDNIAQQSAQSQVRVDSITQQSQQWEEDLSEDHVASESRDKAPLEAQLEVKGNLESKDDVARGFITHGPYGGQDVLTKIMPISKKTLPPLKLQKKKPDSSGSSEGGTKSGKRKSVKRHGELTPITPSSNLLTGAVGIPTSIILPPTYQEAKIVSQRCRGNSLGVPPTYFIRGMTITSSFGEESQDNDQRSDKEIHQAALEGVSSLKMEELALQYGVNFRDQGGRTPLMYAVLGNQPKMCSILLKLNASINAKDMAGLTALLWATYQAKSNIMKILLKNGADIGATDVEGRTAFHWAMKTPNINCLKWLCKLGNDPKIINQYDNEGVAPIHWAVMSDQAMHIKMLLESTEADITLKDREGRTPLNYAVMNFSPSCINVILNYNEELISNSDSKGRKVLHFACAESSIDCVRTLLSYKSCDMDCTDDEGTTPLHWAAAANQPSIVELLLRRGVDRDREDNSNRTPLDYAIEKGHEKCQKLLTRYNLERKRFQSSAYVDTAPLIPAVNPHGHVGFKRPIATMAGFSFSGCKNKPADISQEQKAVVNDEENAPQEVAQEPAGGDAITEGGINQNQSQRNERRGVMISLFGDCWARRGGSVVPM